VLFTNAEVEGARLDVRITGTAITEIGVALERRGEDRVFDAAGGALIPGLHDHHLHLHAMAAALASVRCGPPDVISVDGLASALRSARSAGWIRGVGYHESIAGPLDRAVLDVLVPDRPVRIQHRSGGLWMLNTNALETLRIEAGPDGVEVGDDGAPNGRLWRADELMRGAGVGLPDLASVARQLLDCGITGVTDATPDLDDAAAAHLIGQAASGAFPLRILALGLDSSACSRVTVGPRKILLHDHNLPSLEDLVHRIEVARATNRAVAIHCVTRHALVMTIAALDLAGHQHGDRIEHGAVVPKELRPAIASHDIAVVTQPSFICDRGDAYRDEVDVADLAELYPYRSLCDAGIPVAPSSDAPYGDIDPWHAMQTATDRRTAGGAELAAPERVATREVLDGYLSPLEQPGHQPRRVAVSAPADLCLLRVPLTPALDRPNKDNVCLTVVNGTVVGL
jgi:predicted amidohydrolase YtcJ